MLLKESFHNLIMISLTISVHINVKAKEHSISMLPHNQFFNLHIAEKLLHSQEVVGTLQLISHKTNKLRK